MARDQQPFACDGAVTLEKLQELLAVQAEVEGLDYKEYLDLSHTRHQVELVKDIAAMQSMPDGGYLVGGVTGQGRPSVAHGRLDTAQFDEARLRSIACKWLPEPLTIRSQVYDIDGVPIALIYVGPNPAGFCVIAKDGEYEDPTDRNRKVTVFRAGDVYVRRGTASVRWQQGDLPSLLARWESRIREDERRSTADILRRVDQNRRGSDLAVAPLGSLSWRLDQADFDATVMELLRRSDRYAIRTMLLPLAHEAGAMITNSDRAPDVETMLDRLISLAGIAITFDARDVLEQSVTTIHQIYGIPPAVPENARTDLVIPAERLWLDVAARIEAAGALATRLGAWWAVRSLALRSAATGLESYLVWLRHAVTMAARANLLVSDEGQPTSGAFVGFGRLVAARIPALRPDIPGDATTPFALGVAPENFDPLLDSVAQFDLIWCVLAAALSPKQMSFYPSFSGFWPHRSEPALRLLITDHEAKRSILGDISDDSLQRSIREVLDLAQQEASRHSMRSWQIDPYYVQRLFGDH